MSEVKQVHLVRHGEVNNPTGVLYGRLPGYHLSATGQAMAERLGEWFANIPVDHLRCSPLERAQETMAPIAEGREICVVTDARLIEADNAFAGKVFGKYNKPLLDPRNWWLLRNPFTPSWGEPYPQLAARMLSAIDEVVAGLPTGGQAVLVSHQLPIWTTRLALEERSFVHDPRRRQCILASVTTLRYRDDTFCGLTYAEPARDLLRENGNRAFSSGH